LFPSIKLQWTQVIETSEMSYTKVLNNGSWTALRGWMSVAGQHPPILWVGTTPFQIYGWGRIVKEPSKYKYLQMINKTVSHQNPFWLWICTSLDMFFLILSLASTGVF
jgi:hypothetical protein